jgi:hypothetical protein
VAETSEWPIFATKTRLSLSTPMPPRNQDQSSYKEGQLLLAISAINRGQIKNVHQAAKIYNVPERTLRRRDCRANSTKLTNSGEEALIQHLLELYSRGFGPTLQATTDMANYLINAHDGIPVGINWSSNFITRTPELEMRYNRKYNYQRAKM